MYFGAKVYTVLFAWTLRVKILALAFGLLGLHPKPLNPQTQNCLPRGSAYTTIMKLGRARKGTQKNPMKEAWVRPCNKAEDAEEHEAPPKPCRMLKGHLV